MKVEINKVLSILREREYMWRSIESEGGTEFHTKESAYARALEAMVCTEIVEALAATEPNP